MKKSKEIIDLLKKAVDDIWQIRKQIDYLYDESTKVKDEYLKDFLVTQALAIEIINSNVGYLVGRAIRKMEGKE